MRRSTLATVVLLLAAAFLFVGVAAATNNAARPIERVEWFGVLAVFVVGAALLAAWDPYGFAVFGTILSSAGGAVIGMIWGVSSGTSVATSTVVAGGAACALGFTASVGFLLWTRLSRDPIPDVLRSQFSAASISEKAGVQLTFTAPAAIPSDAVLPVEVVLQNCTSASRTIDLALAEAPLWPGNPVLVSRNPGAIVLAPSEVKRVRFPVCASPRARGPVRVYLRLRVSGRRGRRTRRWRARPCVAPAGLLQIALVSLLFLPLGFALIVVERGGVLLQATPGARSRQPDELPEVAVDTLWAPVGVDVARASPGAASEALQGRT